MDITWKKDTRDPLSKETATINGEVFPLIIESDADGHNRGIFRPNRIVQDFASAARAGRKLDLNDIWEAASLGRYCKEEMLEYYRLIGYSWDGYCEIFEHEELHCTMICDKCGCWEWVHPSERCKTFIKEGVKA